MSVPIKELDLTQARARLSPTIKTLDRGAVAIKVRGQVAAYLVSKETYEHLTRRSKRGQLKGTLKITGDLESFDAEAALTSGGEARP